MASRNPLQCTWRLRRSIPVAGRKKWPVAVVAFLIKHRKWWLDLWDKNGWIYGKWMEMMGTDVWKTVSRNHKHAHFDHVNPFFGLILVIPTWCLVARAPGVILEPQIGTLKMPAMASPVNASDATRFGLWGAVWDVSQIQDAPLPHRAGVVAMRDQCGTNVGRDVLPDVLPHIWISAFGHIWPMAGSRLSPDADAFD